MNKITYTNKISLVTSPLPNENKVTDTDMNEIKSVVNANAEAMIPLGGGCEYYGQTLPSDSFMWADGSLISRTTYADLFAIIGTNYGAGDGSTTFALPDLRRRYPLMKNSSDNLGAKGGSEQKYAKANPTGGGINYQNSNKAFSTNYMTSVGAGSKSETTNSNTNAGIVVVGDSDSTNARDPYLICNYIIRVK